VELSRNHQYLVRGWHSGTGLVSDLANPSGFPQEGCASQCVSPTSRVCVFCPCLSRHRPIRLIYLSVVIAVICQLAYAHKTRNTTDLSWDTWTVAVSTQMAQSLSIVTACSPQFKPFLDSLRSSGMSLGDSSYASKQRTYGPTSYYKASRAAHTGDTRSDTHELVSMHADGINHTTVTSVGDCDSESQSSQAQIIRETRTWAVTEERG
jgi:hypothetical protein